MLTKLNTETFIFDINRPVEILPVSAEFNIRKFDDTTMEVDITKGQNLNDLFTLLTREGITIISMRNKANRLEELFVRLLDKNSNNKRT